MIKNKAHLEELKQKPVSKLNLSEALESDRYEEFRDYSFKKMDKLLK